MKADDRVGVLFVCLGNICRSPLAESVFRDLIREHGVEQHFDVDSAGTSGYHIGESPDSRTVETARARGVEVTGSSRKLDRDDFGRFDYIVAMDHENLAGVQALAERSDGSSKVMLLRDWDDLDRGAGVPDPYYGGPRGFDDVHDIVERSCEALLTHLLAEHDLA